MATIIEIGLAETAQGAITGMVPQSLPWQLHPESIPFVPPRPYVLLNICRSDPFRWAPEMREEVLFHC